jgi:putative peptidoglycan lipid II flippase
VGVAIGVVLLPDLSRKLRSGDAETAMSVHNRALELAWFFTLPAAIALILISGPIIHALFEHGAFNRSDGIATASALSAFAAGLPAFVLIKVFAPGFFAREDTATPMRFAVVSVAVNVAAAISLSTIWRHVGIAAATSIAAWTNALLLGTTLITRHHFIPDRQLRQRLPRMMLACALMAAVLVLGLGLTGKFFLATSPSGDRIMALIFLIASGVVTYFVASQLLKAMTLAELRAMLRRQG